eukprot:3028662-Rhodomonas_salina.1
MADSRMLCYPRSPPRLSQVHDLQATVGALSAQLATLKMKPQVHENAQAPSHSSVILDSAWGPNYQANFQAEASAAQKWLPGAAVVSSGQQQGSLSKAIVPAQPSSDAQQQQQPQPQPQQQQQGGVASALQSLSHKLDEVIDYVIHTKQSEQAQQPVQASSSSAKAEAPRSSSIAPPPHQHISAARTRAA